ncbi:MAG: helix-turn-helix transcriptional regulator [Clostridia bacterium]|nr:helix-turn-helix transcriptional regulator [Clostridia bacterium]
MSGITLCDTCEEMLLHNDILKTVRATLPADKKLFDLAELFKIFGDSTRMKILFVLFSTEVCTCDLAAALNMTASAVSHQLNSLKRAKLIKSRRDGKTVFYSLADSHVKTIIEKAIEHIEE